MGIVRRLPSDLIDRIAAGEVIERPASVVKELLENSMDAGAMRTEVQIEGGGLDRIIVSDNGAGMSPEDALVALERHATSKLGSADDLFNIQTLGFRGEALSSICAVSRMSVTTRRAQDEAGRRIVIEAGEIKSNEAHGCPVGTSIDVQDLFFNTPARRKFMRAPATEQTHIVEACARVSLGHGSAGLVLRAGERRLLDVPELDNALNDSGIARVLAIVRQRARELHPFAGARDDVCVRGYLAPPSAARRDTKGLWFFVNGRFVRDRTLQRALLDGCGGNLERGRYPVCVVHIEMEPREVDVNVHPQKLEVRFSDSRALYRAVSAAISQAFAESPFEAAAVSEISALSLQEALSARPSQAQDPVSYFGPRPEPALAYVAEPKPGLSPAQLPVTLVGRFVLFTDRAGRACCLDSAGARERLAFEQLERELRGPGVEPQPVLFPEIFELPADAAAWLESHEADLGRYGFEIEPVGPQRWAARAKPRALLRETGLRTLVLDVLELARAADDLAVLHRCARFASEDAIDARTAQRLLERVDASMTDLRDRPVLRSITEADLERLARS